MREELAPASEHEILEADMKKLAKEILRSREESEKVPVDNKMLIRQSLERLMPEAEAVKDDKSASPLPEYVKGQSPDLKLEVEYLLDMAFHHGIEKANGVARRSNPFVLDAFHDALVEKLYPELEERGLLK